MGTGRDTIPLTGQGRGPSGYFIGGAAMCLLVVALVVFLLSGLVGTKHAATASTSGTPHAPGSTPGRPSASRAGATHLGSTQAAGAPAVAAGHAQNTQGSGAPATVAGAEGQTTEVRDPEEAKSYPAPSSVHHSAASAPSRAAEAIVAPGATSTAEVRKELAQMHAVESVSRQQTLTPVKGGDSIGGNGTIPIPTNVPEVVQRVIAGANAIADFPYRYGGGHASFIDNAYDCSGSVSYALAAGGLLSAPETSGELESWGVPGPGRYITVYANAGHTYMYVDGILYDTAGRSGVFASRWQVSPVDNSGYVVRHWPRL